MSRQIKDHLGNVFQTKKEMCEHWGVPYVRFSSRVNQGWTYERALTEPRLKDNTTRACTDHLGKKFESINQMCESWGISYQSYLYYRKKGMTVEQSLTKPARKKTGKAFVDHEGHKFSSMKDLTDFWGISYPTFDSRLKRGYSIKEAILAGNEAISSTPAEKRTDHLGQTYSSIKKMCSHWGISVSMLNTKLEKGIPLKDILEKKEEHPYQDHEGNRFKTLSEMAKFWNVSYPTMTARLKRGYSVEDAILGRKKYTDHLGNKFSTLKEMAEHWNISWAILNKGLKDGEPLEQILTDSKGLGSIKPTEEDQKKQERLKHGWSVSEVMAGFRNPSGKVRINNEYIDPNGNRFHSLRALCDHWHLSLEVVSSRIARGVPFNDAFYEPHARTGIQKKPASTVFFADLEATQTAKGASTVYDFLGNRYDSVSDLCAKWKVSEEYFVRHIDCGWTQERTLVKPEYWDPKGQVFRFMTEVAKEWNIDYNEFWYEYRFKNKTIRQAIAACREESSLALA